MKLEEYIQRREHMRQKLQAAQPRGLCLSCLHPPLTCYCQHIQSFDPKIKFVILIHGREAQKRISTGRIAHLCLQDSLLLQGYDYSRDARVNALIADPQYHCVILYPGKKSLNLTQQSAENNHALFPQDKKLLVFVIDGTWVTARKTMYRSTNLKLLPQICFTPSAPSRFRIRKQPRENYCSTVEAIHHTIELLGESRGYDFASRQHDRLLHVFDKMVDQQIELAKLPTKRRRQRKALFAANGQIAPA